MADVTEMQDIDDLFGIYETVALKFYEEKNPPMKIEEIEKRHAVLDDVFRKSLVGAHRQSGTGLEQADVAPGSKGKRLGGAVAGKQARAGIASLQFRGDALGVAEYVRADLQDRGFSIAAGECGEIRFGHDQGDLHRPPLQAFEADGKPRFLGEG